MNTLFSSVCRHFTLGNLTKPPELFSNSLLHTLWRFDTSHGHFILKQFQLAESTISTLQQTQTIARHFFQIGIPTKPALILEDNPIFECNNHAYLVFPWLEGDNLIYAQLKSIHSKRMAKLLSDIHSATITFPDAPPVEAYKIDLQDWAAYGKEAWLIELNAHCLSACAIEPSDSVISHRDLTLANILWQGEECHIIDWDWAGKISRTQDVLATALNLSLMESGQIDMNLFHSFIDSYAMPLVADEIEPGFYRVLANWLNWAMLNFKLSNLIIAEYSLNAVKLTFHHRQEIIDYVSMPLRV
ncbi:MAG: phosphotransferase [Gammaproteobacteria bacterium]|nr:phosphotransferase [Gammaproteobacteria bacterium]